MSPIVLRHQSGNSLPLSFLNLNLRDKIFDNTINPEEILSQLELVLNKAIDIEKTIIFFDEIQVSERAISSLKYFCESENNYKIICV